MGSINKKAAFSSLIRGLEGEAEKCKGKLTNLLDALKYSL